MFGFKFLRQKALTTAPGRQPTKAESDRAAITPEIINQLARGAEWTAQLTAAAPYGMQSGPYGTILYDGRERPITAKLSGASSPYSWVEVYSSAPGTFTTLSGGRTGTANAHDMNGGSGLAGAVVRITSFGMYYFFQVARIKRTCAPGTTSITFNIKGCFGTAIAGAPVSITQHDGSVVSGSTDGSGNFVGGILVPGSYTYTWDAGAGLGSGSGSGSISCGSNVNVNIDFSLVIPGVCCCNDRLYPATLHLTTSAGTCALTQVSHSQWFGSQTVTVNSYGQSFGSPDCVAGAGMHAISVSYQLWCTAGLPTYQLNVTWATGVCSGVWLPFAGGPSPPISCITGFLSAWSSPCGGLPASFTFPSTSTGGACDSNTCPSPITGTAILSV